MSLSVTTDYAKDTGDPSPYLRRIADAGFSHVHWCHHWNTDFLYSGAEIEQVGRWLSEYGLRLLDLHGSAGREKDWASPREWERRAGVELVRNRIEMTARLSGEVTIMHVPATLSGPGGAAVRRSLDELEGFARERGVRIAVENGTFDAVEQALCEYDSGYLGLCYDSGHGNMVDGAVRDGLDRLEALKERLISVHLHDNDGAKDRHDLVFSGTVDWERLAGIIAHSAYAKCASMEVTMQGSGFDDEDAFLAEAFATGTKLASMVEKCRQAR